MATVTTLTPKVSKALDSVQAIETNTTRTEAELSGLLNTTRHIAEQERASQVEQLRQVSVLILRAQTVLTDVDAAVKSANADEQRLGVVLEQASASIARTSDDTHVLLSNAAQSVDPAPIREAMTNIVTSTRNVAATTADAQASMATVRKGIEFEVKALMAPPRKVKWLAEEAARMVGKFLGF